MKKIPLSSIFAFALTGLVVVGGLGCPVGTKTSVEAGVSATVDPTHCKEVQGDAGLALNTSSTVLLDCSTLTGSGTIRIEFPRRSWWDIKLAAGDGGAIDAGPGK